MNEKKVLSDTNILKRCSFDFEKTLNWLARYALLGAY